MFNLVPCPPLTNPDNGTITCSLGDDESPSYKDTCTFICNAGYEPTNSDVRICQSDGSWSDTETMCRRGEHYGTCITIVYVIISILLIS